MVAAALLGLARGDEFFHGFEDFVHPAEVLVEEMVEMYLQEPMISLIFFNFPVATCLTTLQNLCAFLLFSVLLVLGSAVGSRLAIEFDIFEGMILRDVFVSFSNKLTKEVITRWLSSILIQLPKVKSGLCFQGEVLIPLVSLIHEFHYTQKDGKEFI